MSESIKSACVLALMVASTAGALAWIDDGASPVWKILRIICPAIAILALAVFLRTHFRRDIEVDYLRKLGGSYFNRHGLCFFPTITSEDGRAYLTVHFQNQYQGACQGCISVRPGRGFWMARPKISPTAYDIDCGSGAFGMVRQAIAIPHDLQGKAVQFEVGACAEYPQGRGRQLRFHDGVFLRTTSSFSNSARFLSFAALLAGAIYLPKPGTVKLKLPLDVSEEPPLDSTPVIQILWQADVPSLESGR